MGVTEIETATVQPANKLIDAVAGAIGKAYEPRHIRKMADVVMLIFLNSCVNLLFRIGL